MPWLSAVYHLKWEDIVAMPFDELAEYRRQYPEVRRALGHVEVVQYKD